MPEYKKYSNAKEAPSRLSRKRDRNSTFLKNKKASKVAKELRKASRLQEEEIKIGGTD